jgi:hypothetical protein
MLSCLRNWSDAFLDFVVHDDLRRDADVFRQAKRVAVFAVAFTLWAVLYAGIYLLLDSPRCALICIGACPLLLASLVTLRRGLSPAYGCNLVCCGGLFPLSGLAYLSGGWTAAPLLWFSVLPVVAVLTAGVGWGLVWTIIPMAMLGAFAGAEVSGFQFTRDMTGQMERDFAFMVLMGLIVCQFVLAWIRVGIEQRALAALREANKKLAESRRCAEELEAGFGFSLEEWTKLRREKAALEHFIKLRVGPMELEDDALDDFLEDDSLEVELEASGIKFKK